MVESSVDNSKIQINLERFAAGDRSVLDTLLEFACTRLQLLTQTMLAQFAGVRRWEQTDDVLQNAMLRLLRALKDVEPRSAMDFLSLATLQIRRELLDLARHYFGPQGHGTNHASWAGDSQAPPLEKPDATFEPARLAEWREFHEQIDNLPGEHQQVVALLYYQGLTQTEAAEILDVTVRTVQRRWQAALLSLHAKLKDDWPRNV